MITRILGDRRTQALTRRIDRPEAILLAVVQAAVAAVGWLVDPFWLPAAVGGQLAVGGLAAIRVIGPARAGFGFARYAMPATAGVAATLAGRLLPGGVALLLVPLVAVLLWSVLYLEVRSERIGGGRTLQELLLTVIAFAAASGILHAVGTASWTPLLILLAPVGLVLALRAAESRGVGGGAAVGQALLHLLAMVQAGAAVALLSLPGVVGPSIIALAFYAWSGAAEALRGETSGRGVAIEFGALGLLGLAIALIFQRA